MKDMPDRKFIIVLCCIAGLFVGCTRSLPANEIISLLSNDSIKYWNSIWKAPYFRDYRDAGLAFYKNGKLVEYWTNEFGQRIIINVGSIDLRCSPTTYEIKRDTLVINRCGYMSCFIIENLTNDNLKLKEIPPYGFFPDLGTKPGSIPKIFTISDDQKKRPIDDTQY